MKGYDIKVRLDDFRPLTWRDLIIPENLTFHQLHIIMQDLWDFYDEHLYEFTTKDHRTRYINFEKHSMDGIYLPDFNEKDSKNEYITDIFDSDNKIYYYYDFGDSWSFTIEIKKKVDYEENYPYLKRFKGDYGPIEDCGGPYMLSDIVEYKENPDMDTDEYTKEYANSLSKFDLEYKRQSLKENCAFNNKNTKIYKTDDNGKSMENKGFSLFINFNEVVPFTFRNIIVPSGITFSNLHDIIQITVGLNNYHGYQFIELEDKIYITTDPNNYDDEELLDAKTTIIDDYLSKYQYLLYEYDFGETIYLTIERNEIIDYKENYPTVADYMGEYNLIDDCGGTTGFVELLELKNNLEFADEDDLELIKSIEKFDKDKIQKKLKKYCSF